MVQLPPLAGQREVRASLINTLGQVVLAHTMLLTTADATAKFATQELAAGVHMLRLQADNQLFTQQAVLAQTLASSLLADNSAGES